MAGEKIETRVAASMGTAVKMMGKWTSLVDCQIKQSVQKFQRHLCVKAINTSNGSQNLNNLVSFSVSLLCLLCCCYCCVLVVVTAVDDVCMCVFSILDVLACSPCCPPLKTESDEKCYCLRSLAINTLRYYFA